MLLGRSKSSLITTCDDGVEETVSWRDGRRLLRGTRMLGGAWHARLRTTFAGIFELMSQHADFFFISGQKNFVSTKFGGSHFGEGEQHDLLLFESHVRLFHGIDLFSDQLHLADLSINCDYTFMLVHACSH